jgi:hypothetical protein
MPRLNSSAISWIDYHPITFHSGRTDTLRAVPAQHDHGLLNAPSAGWYFNTYLRGRY